MANKQMEMNKKELTKNFNSRMEAAKKILAEMTENGEHRSDRAVQLQLRMKQLELSIRLIWDHNHINEETLRLEGVFNDHLQIATLSKIEKEIKLDQLKLLKKMRSCKKAPCYGRGYTGFNIKTGEMCLCNCVQKNINLFM